MGTTEGTKKGMTKKQLWQSTKKGPTDGTKEGNTKGTTPNHTKGGMSKFLENKKKLWKSIMSQFVQKSTSDADSTATASDASNFGLDPDSECDSLINLSPIEVTSKTLLDCQAWRMSKWTQQS